MLTMKEIRTIKKVLKDYDLYSKSWLKTVKIIYRKAKNQDVNKLKNIMLEKVIKKSNILVKNAQAYQDLICSFEKMQNYTEMVAPVNHVYVGGIKMEHHVTDLDYLYFTCNCGQLASVCEAYNELNKTNFNNDVTKSKVLIVLISALYHQSCYRTESDNLWSISSRVEEIKAAEEKYGEKFFVNDYLYDTFTRPELFESYGVYKKGEVFSMNKNSIIQDNL